MNFQDILNPVADFLVFTFEAIMPMGNLINWACIAVGAVGMLYWLKLQKDYNTKAEQDGTVA